MDDIYSQVLELLKSERMDITTSEVASRLGIDRHTAAKHLEVLLGKGLLDCRSIGKSKMWKLSDAPIIRALKENDELAANLRQVLDSVDDSISIQDNAYKIVWTNKEEDAKGHSCFEVHAHGKDVCKSCPMERTIRTGKANETTLKGKNIRIITKPIKDKDNNTVAVVEIVKKLKDNTAKSNAR